MFCYNPAVSLLGQSSGLYHKWSDLPIAKLSASIMQIPKLSEQSSVKRLAKNKPIERKYKMKGIFIDKICGVVHCSLSVEVKGITIAV